MLIKIGLLLTLIALLVFLLVAANAIHCSLKIKVYDDIYHLSSEITFFRAILNSKQNFQLKVLQL